MKIGGHGSIGACICDEIKKQNPWCGRNQYASEDQNNA
jgi:hypothetical protein